MELSGVETEQSYWQYQQDPDVNLNRPITTHDLISWAFQIARGMDYLASKKVYIGVYMVKNSRVHLNLCIGPSRRFGRSECFAGRRWSCQSGRFWNGQKNVLRGQLRENGPGVFKLLI